jgi:hypothetical protein
MWVITRPPLDFAELDLTQDDLEKWYEDPETFIPDPDGLTPDDIFIDTED